MLVKFIIDIKFTLEILVSPIKKHVATPLQANDGKFYSFIV